MTSLALLLQSGLAAELPSKSSTLPYNIIPKPQLRDGIFSELPSNVLKTLAERGITDMHPVPSPFPIAEPRPLYTPGPTIHDTRPVPLVTPQAEPRPIMTEGPTIHDTRPEPLITPESPEWLRSIILKLEGAKGGEIFDKELSNAMKQPYEMTQKEFGEIPVIKYIRERLADKANPMNVSERNQLAQQLVDSGIMSIDDFNAMTGQHGFGGVSGAKNLTTGKPIPSKTIDTTSDMGSKINYIGQWHTFRVSADWFAHRHQILKALEEGKSVPKEVLAEYIGWTSGTGEENQTEWAANALKKLYPGENTDKIIKVSEKLGKIIEDNPSIPHPKNIQSQIDKLKQEISDLSKLSPKKGGQPRAGIY